MELLDQTREAAARMYRQYGGNNEDVPHPGRRYAHRRVPTVVECITVLPSYHEHGRVGIYVLLRYVSEPTTQTPPHLVCEPLAWFNEKFKEEEE